MINIHKYFTNYYCYRAFKKLLGIVKSIFIRVMITGILAAIALIFFIMLVRQLMVVQKQIN
jgi:hypothetical protein